MTKTTKQKKHWKVSITNKLNDSNMFLIFNVEGKLLTYLKQQAKLRIEGSVYLIETINN